MDAMAVLGIVGGIALLVAFYGGLDVDRVRIPPLPRPVRLVSGTIGALLIFFVMWVSYQQLFQAQSPIDNNIPQATASPVLQVTPGEIPPAGTNTPAGCGELELTFINPGALLENNIRLYKLFGTGFCSDTLISVTGRAFVGNDPTTTANGQPFEVSGDGTWLTVYILPSPSPEVSGQTITVRNPNGSTATLFVSYQR